MSMSKPFYIGPCPHEGCEGKVYGQMRPEYSDKPVVKCIDDPSGQSHEFAPHQWHAIREQATKPTDEGA